MDSHEKSIVAPGHYGNGTALQSDAMPSTQGPAHELMREAEAAYREAHPLILLMAKNAGFNQIEQREIAQRVGLVLVEKADEYDPSRGTHRMWAAGIARNILLDARRTARAERRRTDRSGALKQIPSPTLTPEETLRARESLVLLREGVRPEHRAVLDLNAQGCTGAEIAEMLGLSQANVDWRRREARKDLDVTLLTMGEDRKEITRVREAFFFGAAFCGLSGASRLSEAPAPASAPPPEIRPSESLPPPGDLARPAGPRFRPSSSWDLRPAASRLWGAAQSVFPLAMAAVVVLVLGGIVGVAARFEDLAAAVARRAPSAPTPEVPCFVPADEPREALHEKRGDTSPPGARTAAPAPSSLWNYRRERPDRAPERERERRILAYLSTGSAARAREAGAPQTSPQAARGISMRGGSSRSARRREWLVIRALLGLRRDAEVAKIAVDSRQPAPRSRAFFAPEGRGMSISP